MATLPLSLGMQLLQTYPTSIILAVSTEGRVTGFFLELAHITWAAPVLNHGNTEPVVVKGVHSPCKREEDHLCDKGIIKLYGLLRIGQGIGRIGIKGAVHKSLDVPAGQRCCRGASSFSSHSRGVRKHTQAMRGSRPAVTATPAKSPRACTFCLSHREFKHNLEPVYCG